MKTIAASSNGGFLLEIAEHFKIDTVEKRIPQIQHHTFGSVAGLKFVSVVFLQEVVVEENREAARLLERTRTVEEGR